MQKALRALFPIGVLILGWFGYGALSKEEEKKKRPKPPERVIRTQVLKLERQDFQTIVRTQGIVRPHSEASLTAQVSGKVKAIAPLLEDGAFFEKDDILLELDDEDLAASIVTAEADLARAEAAFAQEEARAKQAKLNWEDLGYDEEPNDLVLRLPQLREAEANVAAAKASVQRAKRDFERAVVRAPFDGRVLRRTVAVGQSITSATPLATIFNTDFVEVRLPIANRQLSFVDLPESQDDPPVAVELSDTINEEVTAIWHGEIIGTEGALDPNSRELFAIARVPDPFSRKAAAGEKKRAHLRVGQPVAAAIDGRVLDDVFIIPRTAIRNLKRIYIVDPEENQWQMHEIDPVWEGIDNVVIRDPEIVDNALLATTRQTYAPNIARVEILPEIVEEAGEDAEEEKDAAAGTATKKTDQSSS